MEIIFKIIIIILLIKCYNKIEDGENMENLDNSKKIKVIWFYRDSCPHCVNMKKNWSDLYTLYENDSNKNKLFELVKIDVSKISLGSMKKYDSRITIDDYKNGVPNIVLYGNDIHTYNGDRTASDMDQWISNFA